MNLNTTLSNSEIDPSDLTRNRRTLGTGAIISLVLFLFLEINYGWRQAALFIVGLAAGVILYHAAFGFTAAWRDVVKTGRGAGLRAQMIMLALTVIVFTPLIADTNLGNKSFALNGLERADACLCEKMSGEHPQEVTDSIMRVLRCVRFCIHIMSPNDLEYLEDFDHVAKTSKIKKENLEDPRRLFLDL